MFAKHKATKSCYLTFCYHSPASDPHEIHAWDVTSTSQSIEASFTPSVPCPSLVQPSLETETHATEYIPNPNPCNEYLGFDDEGLYIDLSPQKFKAVNPHNQQREPKTSQSDYDLDSDDESASDEEDEIEDIDVIVTEAWS